MQQNEGRSSFGGRILDLEVKTLESASNSMDPKIWWQCLTEVPFSWDGDPPSTPDVFTKLLGVQYGHLERHWKEVDDHVAPRNYS